MSSENVVSAAEVELLLGGGCSELILCFFQYSNWDATHDFVRCFLLLLLLLLILAFPQVEGCPPELAKKDLAGALSKLLSKWSGPFDSQCTLEDPSTDSDEYDSGWI